jgi:hypothetical protein
MSDDWRRGVRWEDFENGTQERDAMTPSVGIGGSAGARGISVALWRSSAARAADAPAAPDVDDAEDI